MVVAKQTLSSLCDPYFGCISNWASQTNANVPSPMPDNVVRYSWAMA